MADYPKYSQQQYPQWPGEGVRAPSTSQILAVLTLLPIGGTLLFLAGATLVGTLIGLAVSTPVFLIFSPVLVPAALVLGLGVVGFLAAEAFGITGLSSLAWMANYFRQMRESLPQQLEQAKQRAREAAGEMGQKARETAGQAGQKVTEAGQTAQGRAQEVTGQEGTRT